MLQVERFFRQSRNKLIIERVQFVSTLSKGRNFTINSFDIVAVFGHRVECCFDIVAGVDGALWSQQFHTDRSFAINATGQCHFLDCFFSYNKSWPSNRIYPEIIPAKSREYVFTGVGLCVCVCVCVCLSVTTITKKIVDGFAPNFMRRFLGEREDQVRVSLRSVEGCGSNGQKTP